MDPRRPLAAHAFHRPSTGQKCERCGAGGVVVDSCLDKEIATISRPAWVLPSGSTTRPRFAVGRASLGAAQLMLLATRRPCSIVDLKRPPCQSLAAGLRSTSW